jgi:glycosyltransferase involved in cell wall biosynthesis
MKKVLLVNWDNYPNIPSGGIYVWEKDLIDNMQDFEFIVVNILSNSNTRDDYSVPSHVKRVINVPLYGCYRIEEFYKERNQALFSKILRTRTSVIENEFLPLYREFLVNLLSENCNYSKISEIIFKLHKFLLKYDFKKCVEHPYIWELFIEQISRDYLYREITIKEVQFIFQIIQRMIQLLSIKIPEIDIIHCSLAWIPSIIAVFAKMESNCPVLITEHGLAFRDLSLYHSSYMHNAPSNILWKYFSGNIIRTMYWNSDKIIPCCYANAIWEKDIGADPSKIKVIHNGVDTKKYRSIEGISADINTNHPPTIVFVGRIEILKDILTLIESIKYVKEQIPNVQCLIYGNSTDPNYSIQLINMVRNWGLNENIKFMGKTSEPEKAYNTGDIVVLSSVAEGFPYTIIEAMACKKAIVSTDVGGVGEALKGCGLLVRSRHPYELASAIVRLLDDKNLRDELGIASAIRANQMFTLKKSVNEYIIEYNDLINRRATEDMIRIPVTANKQYDKVFQE